MKIKKYKDENFGWLKVVHLTEDNIFEVAELAKISEFIYDFTDEPPLGFINKLGQPFYVGNFIVIGGAKGFYGSRVSYTHWTGHGGTYQELEKEFEELEDYED